MAIWLRVAANEAIGVEPNSWPIGMVTITVIELHLSCYVSVTYCVMVMPQHF